MDIDQENLQDVKVIEIPENTEKFSALPLLNYN